jgi:hypothetical protein
VRSLAEKEKETRAAAALGCLPWAVGIVNATVGPTPHPGARFELRFAYELHLAGIAPIRPFRAGVDGTDIDFRVPALVPWNIELLSVGESEAIGAARTTRKEGAIQSEELHLGLTGDAAEDRRRVAAKQTPEHDLRRMISKLGEKGWENKKSRPVKFPRPDGSAVNMLLVDVRSYLGGDASIDEFDCRQMLLGPQGMRDYLVMWHPTGSEPLRGIWDPANQGDYAIAARERIQVVGFVHEEAFADDEIRQVTLLFKNPAFSIDLATNPLGWPSCAARRIGLRTENALWNPG